MSVLGPGPGRQRGRRASPAPVETTVVGTTSRCPLDGRSTPCRARGSSARGADVTVFKGVGRPLDLAVAYDLATSTAGRVVAHTRMATESARRRRGCHPFSVGPDLCLVHNGSFANHATIRRELRAEGVEFDSENDTEVGARFVGRPARRGRRPGDALKALCDRFDGFYTLLVTSADGFAVVRDAIACKPAIIAETDDWVAMASEFRALADLPGIDSARIFEPEPEGVYPWAR